MKALVTATITGTLLQLAMVFAGHSNPAVAKMFAVGGMAISLLAGLTYAVMARGSRGDAAKNGAVAGGVCAFIGIAVSCALHDVAPIILVIGTLSSTVTGLIGGIAGQLAVGRRTA